jgi:hypothetical protein
MAHASHLFLETIQTMPNRVPDPRSAYFVGILLSNSTNQATIPNPSAFLNKHFAIRLPVLRTGPAAHRNGGAPRSLS